jgi:tripartite-type tricarboxylate transporter receptor subunit TctC
MQRNANMLTRRTALAASAVAAAIGAVRAKAQTLRKTVHIVVGFPAGGATDLIARILADRLRGRYAAAVIVENKPGGAARVAVDYIKNAEPDGSEFLFTPDFPITVYPHSFRSLSYDPLRDLVPVAPASRSTLTFVIGPAVPGEIKSLVDFVAWCTANPEKSILATPAAGGPPDRHGDVSHRRHVRGACRLTLPPHRRPFGQADRVGCARLGPGDTRPLRHGRAGLR